MPYQTVLYPLCHAPKRDLSSNQALASENLQALDGENLQALASENLQALDGENLQALDGENLQALDGENLQALDGENLQASDNKILRKVSRISFLTGRGCNVGHIDKNGSPVPHLPAINLHFQDF